MLTAWRLFNFKSVRDDTTIPLAPLTVLAGANSSGKSTVLQSMLMIAQTLQSPVTERPIVLNGPMVRLGTFDDVRSYGSDAGTVLVGFALRARAANIGSDLADFVVSTSALTCHVAFDVGDAQELSRLHPTMQHSMIKYDHRRGVAEATTEFWLRRSSLAPRLISKHRLGAILGEFLPDRIFDIEHITNSEENSYTGRVFVNPQSHFLPESGWTIRLIDGDDLNTRLPRSLKSSCGFVRSSFRGFRYLGPLRDEPRALYPLSTTADTTDVGLRGEHTAAVFDLHRNTLVRYLPSASFPAPAPNAPALDKTLRPRSLEAAVLDWLRYFGVVDTLTTRDLGNLGHELKVTTPGIAEPHNLTHVGAGVSQVLPIVVMCLLAEEGSTILIEQPELHLHPRVQTLLGDFFLAASLAGRQVIVETHSEYLVNRLRYRIAASEGEDLAQTVKTYFVEKNEKGASVFRDVKVNRYGAIAEWPKGFFDQSQREIEQILLAGAQKKKAERSRGGNDGSSGA